MTLNQLILIDIENNNIKICYPSFLINVTPTMINGRHHCPAAGYLESIKE
jgi:hypothetical protein